MGLLSMVLLAGGVNYLTVDSPVLLDTISIKITREEPLPYVNHVFVEPGEPANIARLLHGKGGVYTQQSQGGGGSPIIRGFEANRILLQAEGVPLNMSIFRSGHLQNSILWSQCVVEEIEVSEGGNVYNEALGGTVNFKLKKPAGRRFEFVNRLNSAMRSWFLCSNVSWDSTFIGVSFSTFGDIVAGKRLPEGGEKWLRQWYVATKEQDYVITNPEPHVQKPSGYKHVAGYIRKQLNKHDFWIYLTATSNIPRYDRLTLEKYGQPKYSEWYYGPHVWVIAKDRYSVNAKTDIEGMAFFYRESRHRRKFNNPWRWNQFETVMGLHINVNKQVLNGGRLQFSNRYEHVFSRANLENVFTGFRREGATRYPQGSTDVWVSHLSFYRKSDLSETVKAYFNVVGGSMVINSQMGKSKEFYPFLPNRIFKTYVSWGGFVGIMYEESDFEAGLLFRRAFKFPNVDDLAKVFDSKPGTVFIPSSNLKAEVVYSWELPVIVKPKGFYLKFTPVYQTLKNRITALASNDSIEYEGELSQVYYITNVERGNAIGFSAFVKAILFERVEITADGRYLQGRIISVDGERLPLSHVPPATVLTQIMFPFDKNRKIFFEWYWQDAKPSRLYNPGSEDNLEYALDYGLPVVNILNAGFMLNISNNSLIYLGVDNIFDLHWRSFASGISNPGRSVIFELKIKI